MAQSKDTMHSKAVVGGKLKPFKSITDLCKTTVKKTQATYIANKLKNVKTLNITIAANYFARVIYRTPFDEEYLSERETENGISRRTHKPDESYIREDYYIKAGRSGLMKITDFINSELLRTNTPLSTFEALLQQGLLARLMSKKSTPRTFTITNTNPHFTNVEYGDIRGDNSFSGQKSTSHGVVNKYSVQAPRGMLGITRAEFYSNPASFAVDSVYDKTQYARTSDAEIEQIEKMLDTMSGGKLVIGDF